MKILTVKQFKNLLEDNPNKRYAFVEYTPDVINSELMVTDNDGFGATNVIPWHGEVFDWDFNIDEYRDDSKELFMVFDNNDIAQMIQTLSCAFNDIPLSEDYGVT